MRDLSLYGHRIRRDASARLSVPTAVIADLDGTLVDVSRIRHLAAAGDYDAFHKASADCPPNHDALAWVCRKYTEGHAVLVFTGRHQRYHGLSRAWINAHVPVPVLGPFMRADDDYRPDHVVKREMYDQFSNQYAIRECIDDRPTIVELWRSLKLPVTVIPGWED